MVSVGELAVLRRLGRRHAQTFADVWQVAAWAESSGLGEVLHRPAASPVLVPRLPDEGGR